MSAEEEVLRRALEAEAGRVEISADALSVIRRRVAARRGWRRLLAPPRQVSLAFGAGGSPVTPSVLVSVDEAIAVPPGSLAIYYLGATRNGPLLYREFHAGVPNDGSPAGRAKAALTEMLERPALDPDYTSHWPG